MAEKRLSKAVPDYEQYCFVCGQSPIVIIETEGQPDHNTELCGPCCFGEDAMLDVNNWNGG